MAVSSGGEDYPMDKADLAFPKEYAPCVVEVDVGGLEGDSGPCSSGRACTGVYPYPGVAAVLSYESGEASAGVVAPWSYGSGD